MPHTFPVLTAAAGSLLLFAACGKSGGGSSDRVAPRLVGAAFAGSTSPAPGDGLVLSFSEDVAATLGATVDATVLTLSGAGSVGTGTTVQSQPTTRSVRLVLGTAAAFAPGTTTVDLASTNTTIADLAGNFGVGSTPVVIASSDGQAPTIANLTLAAVDDPLNGTGTAGGTLQVPQSGFTIDLAYADAGSPTPLGVDAARTQITADVAVGSASGVQPAGTNLVPLLTQVTGTTAVGKYEVPGTMNFATGAVTLTATVLDGGGLQSAPITFSFTVRAWTDTLRPFETTVNSQQVWFLDTSRDVESLSTVAITGGASIDITAGANARSDYLDTLFALGLLSTAPPIVSGSLDSNDVVLQRLQAAILADLASYFAGTRVTFTFTAPGGSFGSNTSVGYASLGFSQICLGGSDDQAGDVLGIAQLDPNNQRQNNDCVLESASTSRLGVFLHTMADTGLGPPSTSDFRRIFREFVPVLANPPIATGTPVGDATGDAQRLATPPTLNDTRTDLIDEAIAGLARFIAVVTAHECGHSMGLVTTGPMPTGLYGGDAVNFPGSTEGHIRNAALFTAGGVNIMSPQLNFDLARDSHTAFNSLNLAYLREQAFYGN